MSSFMFFFLFSLSLSLVQEFELRKQARQEGRRYCDPIALTYQAEIVPEQIRLKVVYTLYIHTHTYIQERKGLRMTMQQM